MIFIDWVHVKAHDGPVADRPICVALAVTVEGPATSSACVAGDGGEGAKYWLHVLTETRNRGVEGVCVVVCDGLKGLPDAIGTAWPQAVTRYAGRQDRDKISRALKPICTAPSMEAPEDRPLRGGAVPQVRHRDPPLRLHGQRDQVGQRSHTQSRPGRMGTSGTRSQR